MGFTIKIIIFCEYFFKKDVLFVNSSSCSSSSSSSITYNLLNNSNIAYFWHNVFNNLNQSCILTVCREYL